LQGLRPGRHCHSHDHAILAPARLQSLSPRPWRPDVLRTAATNTPRCVERRPNLTTTGALRCHTSQPCDRDPTRHRHRTRTLLVLSRQRSSVMRLPSAALTPHPFVREDRQRCHSITTIRSSLALSRDSDVGANARPSRRHHSSGRSPPAMRRRDPPGWPASFRARPAPTGEARTRSGREHRR
jgi:hypothetical protein